MKILWLSHFIPYPPKGGALQRSHHLLVQAARRQDVSLVTLNQPRILGTRPEIEDAVTVLEGHGCTVDWFPILTESSRARWTFMTAAAFFSGDPYDVRWLDNPAMKRHLSQLGAQDPPDVVHVDTVGLAPYLEALPDVPYVLTHHNVESHMAARRARQLRDPVRATYLARDAKKLARLEERWVPGAATNLVVSELDGDRLLDRVPGCRVDVVENGVDLEYFKPVTDVTRQEGLVFAGTYSWYPNVQAVEYILEELWPALSEAHPGRTLTLVGKDPFPGLVAAGKADPRIRVPGFVDDIRPYLDGAAIYICPIRDGGGTRLKILDALAMAKPLVATAMAVEGLDLVDGVHYLRAEATDDYLKQIARLEGSSALRASLGAAGRAHMESRFGWEQIGGRLNDTYRRAANGNGNRP